MCYTVIYLLFKEGVKLKKLVCIIIIIIAFISLFISTYILFLNRITLKITTDNAYILSYLNSYDIPSSNIKKISFGRSWGNGYLLIYYEDGSSISTYIYEGETKKGDLASYVKNNGYSEGKIVIPIFIVSLVVTIISIILLLYFAIK